MHTRTLGRVYAYKFRIFLYNHNNKYETLKRMWERPTERPTNCEINDI